MTHHQFIATAADLLFRAGARLLDRQLLFPTRQLQLSNDTLCSVIA